jgi:poly(hydroxyalkanoate) depolymerase family esterase
VAVLASPACGSSSSQAVPDAGTAADGALPQPDGASPRSDGGFSGSDGGSAGRPDGSSPGDDGSAAAFDASGDAPGGQLLSRSYGGRDYLLYVPVSYTAGTPAPLVVMLHGCTQTPADFAAGTQMDAQADAAGFLVAYPDEPTSANTEQCFNWFLPADQARGAGEPQLLAGIVGDVAGAYAVDAHRVYAAGLSAGAAMAVVLGATYPDVFAAIGAHSGLEYQAATDVTSGLTASASGGPDPTQQGDAAYAAMGAYARVVPVVVFQGTADTTVAPANGAQVAAQWVETDTKAGAKLAAAASTPGAGGGKSYTLTTYADAASGAPLVEEYLVSGLAHAWSGGSTAGTFTDPAAPDASAIMWAFFAAHPK